MYPTLTPFNVTASNLYMSKGSVGWAPRTIQTRAWPGGIGGVTTELVAGDWASAFTTASRTNAAAADDNRRGTIFRFVGMLLFHFHWFARGAHFRANSCGAMLLQTSSMLGELCKSVKCAISM